MATSAIAKIDARLEVFFCPFPPPGWLRDDREAVDQIAGLRWFSEASAIEPNRPQRRAVDWQLKIATQLITVDLHRRPNSSLILLEAGTA